MHKSKFKTSHAVPRRRLWDLDDKTVVSLNYSRSSLVLQAFGGKLELSRVKQATLRNPLKRRRGSTVPPAPYSRTPFGSQPGGVLCEVFDAAQFRKTRSMEQGSGEAAAIQGSVKDKTSGVFEA